MIIKVIKYSPDEIVGKEGDVIYLKQTESTNFAPSDVLTITHNEDLDYLRFININSSIPAGSYTDTTLDFDTVDETNYIKEDTNIEFIDGTIKRKNAGGSNSNYQTLLDTFSTVIYVDQVNGNDTTGDGSIGNPYASYDKGYNSTPSGQCLALIEGTWTHTKAYTTSEVNGIFNWSKNITIVGVNGDPTKVKLIADAGNSTNVRSAFRTTNVSYNVYLYGVWLELKNAHSTTSYMSCFFRYRSSWSGLPRLAENCVIVNRHGAGFEYLSSGGASGCVIKNCDVFGISHQLSNYGADGNFTWKNSDIHNVATNVSGGKLYNNWEATNVVSNVDSYILNNTPPADCLHLGDPTTPTNPDGSRANIGVWGSKYAKALSSYDIGSSYITTTDLSQINTSSMDSIDSITITQDEPTNTDIKYAYSTDGRTTWKSYKRIDDLDYNSISMTDTGSIDIPTIIKESDTSYKMWYSYYNGTVWDGVYYATSTDGINWTKQGNVFRDASFTHVLQGNVVKISDTSYKLWYSAVSTGNWEIRYATSTDGITWSTGQASLAIPSYNLIPITIRQESGTSYKMWFNKTNTTTGVVAISYVSSTDGITWTNENVLTVPTPDYFSAPEVFYEENKYKMIYQSQSTPTTLYYTESTDGITNWTPVTKIANADDLGFTSIYLARIIKDTVGYNLYIVVPANSKSDIRLYKWNGEVYKNHMKSITLSELATEGTSYSDIINNFNTIGSESLISGTLDFAMNLETSNTAVTPSIDQISINYTLAGYWKNITGVEFDDNFKVELTPTTTTLTNIGTNTYNIKFNVEL